MIFGLDKKKHKRNDHKTNQKISKSSKHFIYVLSKMLLWTKKEKCCFNNNYNQKTVKCLVHRKLWTYKWCALQFNDSVNSCVLYLFLVSPISVYIYIHVFHTHTAKYGFCLWIFTWFYLTCSFVFATYEMKPKKRKKTMETSTTTNPTTNGAHFNVQILPKTWINVICLFHWCCH